MKFESSELKNKYQSYRNYLEARCEALPRQIERRFKNCEANHQSSGCFGMSNYISIEKQNDNGDYIDSITIRISDHDPTGSGEHCDFYLYINGEEWKNIKKEVFEIVENFMKN